MMASCLNVYCHLNPVHMYMTYFIKVHFHIFTLFGPTQPPIHWVPGGEVPGREADYSLPSSAVVKNAWS